MRYLLYSTEHADRSVEQQGNKIMVNMKKNTLAIGSVVILVFSVIAFVFIPAAGGQYGGSAKAVLGKWKNKQLNYTADGLFLRSYRQLHRAAEMRGYLRNDSKVSQEFIEHHMMRTAFNASMIQLAAQEEVLGAGFYLPNKNINKELISFYTDGKGVYSDKLYRETSEQQRLANRKDIVDHLTTQRYIEDNFGTYDSLFGLKTSSAEISFVQKMAEKERIFKYVVFEEGQFPKDKIRSYGQEHADLFAEHSLLMLTFDSQDNADKTAKDLEKGALTFEDAVVTRSTKRGTDSAGKLLAPYRTTVNKTFPESKDLDTVLKLEAGKVSPVVKTAGGYAIVKATAAVKPADFSLDATQERVFSYMKENERGIIEDYLEQKAKTFAEAAKMSGFAAQAASNDLVVQVSNPVALNYGNVDMLPRINTQSDTFFAGAVRNEAFFKQVFALKPDEISDPLLLGSHVLVVQLDAEKSGSAEQSNTASYYRQFASMWYQEYPLAMFAFQKLPLGQQTFIDFVLKNTHFTDSFNTVFK